MFHHVDGHVLDEGRGFVGVPFLTGPLSCEWIGVAVIVNVRFQAQARLLSGPERLDPKLRAVCVRMRAPRERDVSILEA